MSYLKLALVVIGALIVQLTVFVDVRAFGVAPELLALVGILAGFLAGPDRGSTIAFGAGLLWDVWLPTPLGLAAICFAVVAFAIGSVGDGLYQDSQLQVATVAAASTFAVVLGYAGLGEIVGQRGLVDVELLRVAMIAGVLNGVLAPVMLRPMRWALRVGEPTRGAAVHR